MDSRAFHQNGMGPQQKQEFGMGTGAQNQKQEFGMETQ